MVSTGVLISP